MRGMAVCGAFLTIAVACAKTAPTGSDSTAPAASASAGASSSPTSPATGQTGFPASPATPEPSAAGSASAGGGASSSGRAHAASTPTSQASTPSPAALAALDASAPALTGTSWRVASAASAAVSLSSVPTITFDKPEHVTGSTGCNRFSGSAAQAGASLRFGALLSTRRACAESALMDQERRFLQALESCRSWRWTVASAGPSGRDLELLDEGGSVVLRLEAVPKNPGEE